MDQIVEDIKKKHYKKFKEIITQFDEFIDEDHDYWENAMRLINEQMVAEQEAIDKIPYEDLVDTFRGKVLVDLLEEIATHLLIKKITLTQYKLDEAIANGRISKTHH